MPQILNKYEGTREQYPYSWGVAHHNFILTSLPKKTSTGFYVVNVKYTVTTYRLESADQHVSLFSTNEDKNVSSFQGTHIAEFGFVTSSKPTANYVSGIATDLTPAQLEFLFKRPGVEYTITTVGTTAPTEIAANLALLDAQSIDPDTLDDSA